MCDTRCTSTASCIDDVTTNRVPKVCTAQRTMSCAGADASSRPARFASCSRSVVIAGPARRVPPGGRRIPAGSLHSVTMPGITADHPLHVVGQLRRDDLVPAQLAAEPAIQPKPPTQMHLEAFDLVALRVGDQLALEPNIGDLDPGTRVGAAVEVHRHWSVQGGLKIG